MSFKTVFTRIGLCSILIAFTQCASSQKIDKVAPVTFKQPYFQNWVAGIKGGGAGFMVYLPIDENPDVKLEEIYFKGKSVKLERKRNEAVYVGRYTDPKTLRDENLIMSGDRKEEFKNKPPGEVEKKIPFELKADECVISYTKDGKIGYFKLDKLPEKQMEAYPMSPARQ